MSDGLLAAATHPWGSWQVLLPLLAAWHCSGSWSAVEGTGRDHRSSPLDFFANRTRVVANFVTLFLAAAFISYFFLLTLYEQQVLGYSPLQGGPVLSHLRCGDHRGHRRRSARDAESRRQTCTRNGLLRVCGRPLAHQRPNHASTYWHDIAPGMFILAFFAGIAFPALNNAALHRVTGEDSSLASGVQISMQQIGGAIGLSAWSRSRFATLPSQVTHGVPAPIAATSHGYDLAWRRCDRASSAV